MECKIVDVLVPMAEPEDVLANEVWPVIQPEWTGKQIIKKELTSGFINQSTLYRAATTTNDEDERDNEDEDSRPGLVVRLYHNATSGGNQEKCDEFLLMQVAHHAGCFSAVRAVLRNGLIYEYMPGRNIGTADISNPRIARNLARSLARLHWIDTSGLQLIDRAGNPTTLPRTDCYIQHMREAVEEFTMVPCSSEIAERMASLIKLDELRREIDFVEDYLTGLDLPIANTHDDLHFWNILYDDKTERVNILDYEIGSHRAMATVDLTFILDMNAWNKNVVARHLPPNSYPESPASHETKLMWLTEYLKQKHEMEEGQAGDVTEEELELWFTMLQITDVLFYITRLTILLTTFRNSTSFEFILALYEVGHQVYFERKHRLPSLRQRYLEQRKRLDTRGKAKRGDQGDQRDQRGQRDQGAAPSKV